MSPRDRPEVQIYPTHPGARRSVSHWVRAHGRSVFVERHAAVSYARFAMRGRVTIEIDVDRPITSFRVFPTERVVNASASGRRLEVTMVDPLALVVWIDELEKLFLIPDPIEIETESGHAAATVDVRDFGADPTGATVTTRYLQAAIDHAAAVPGGATVVLPAGIFRSGTLEIRSNVTLRVDAGSILVGSRDPADYPVDQGRHETAADATLPPDVRYLGRTMTFSRLLLVDQASNVRIIGRGTIDGQGAFLRSRHGAAPNLVRIRQSTDVDVSDVLFRDAAAWSLHVLASRRVGFRNVKVINDRSTPNSDGIDPDMSSEVAVDRSFIYTKDDAICVKASGNGDLSGDVRHVVATNNLVSSVDAALKVGTESQAALFEDIRFEHNHIFESGRAMSVVVRDGAVYSGVVFRGVEIDREVGHLIEQVIGVRDPAAALGVIRDLTFDDVRAPAFRRPSSNWTWFAQFRPSRPGPDAPVATFEGADDVHALSGLVFRGVVVNGVAIDGPEAAASMANITIGPHVRDVRFE